MAGIGFKLRRLSSEGGLYESVWAYAAAGVITSGPWLLTVLALAVAGLVSGWLGLDGDRFMAIMVYSYALTMVLTGAQQNLITRYLADRLYSGEAGRHMPTLVGALLLNAPLLAGVATVGYALLPLGPATRVLGVSLFVLVGMIWLAMVFLGSVRAYASIVGSFLGGTLVFLLSLAVVIRLWPDGALLLSAVLGQGTTFFLMLGILVREFTLDLSWDFSFLRYARRYPYLGLAGLLLNLGVWVGVFVYWASSRATVVGGLRVYGPHDNAAFLALLSTIVASAMFFVTTETEFYDGYRAFFGGINQGRVRFAELRRRKEEMRAVLLRGLGDIVRVQGLVTLTLVFFAGPLLRPLQPLPLAIQLLPACAVGALLLILLQFTLMILYYYEAYQQACWCALTLVAGNLGVALWSLSLPPSMAGWGLAAGSGSALLLGLYLLRRCLDRLEFTTFMKQPMPGLEAVASPQDSLACTLMRDGQWLVEVSYDG